MLFRTVAGHFHEVNAFCCSNAAKIPSTPVGRSSPEIGIVLALRGFGEKKSRERVRSREIERERDLKAVI